MTTALVGYYEYDTLRLRYRANAAPASLDAYVLYEYDAFPGKAYRDDVPTITTFTTTWSEVATEGDPSGGGAPSGGPGCKIVGGGVFLRSSATSLVKGSLYARLLVARQNTAYEECLACGYVYDSKPFLSIGEHEHIDMGDAIAQMDVTLQQANVAGGAIIVTVVPGAGSAFNVVGVRAINSGTNGINVRTDTAAAGTQILAHIAVSSGAATNANLGVGMVSTSNTSSSNVTGLGESHVVSGTQSFRVAQTVAGAQNDTLRVIMFIRVKGALPTAAKDQSTNEADVTATAGALSFAFIS